MQFATSKDIKEAIEKIWKAEFGQQFTIDPRTELGQILEAQAKMWDLELLPMLIETHNSIYFWTAQGYNLDIWADNNSQPPRLQGSKAYGLLSIEGVPGTVVREGYKVKNDLGFILETKSTVVLDNLGRATVQIEALDTGAEYNSKPNTVIYKVDANENITRVYNSAEITGGAEIETDFDYRIRISKDDSTENSSENGIREAIINMPGVRDVKVIGWRNDSGKSNSIDDKFGLTNGTMRVLLSGIYSDEIAQKLFQTYAAGTTPIGDITRYATDSNGLKVPVSVSLSKNIRGAVKISDVIPTPTPEIIDAIKKSVISYTETLGLGDIYRFKKVQGKVYEIVDEANVQIGIYDDFGSITYQQANIDIKFEELVGVDEADIEVVNNE
ncbi:MAG: baseplate J/gp47 family protein [Cetobacterium sp.]